MRRRMREKAEISRTDVQEAERERGGQYRYAAARDGSVAPPNLHPTSAPVARHTDVSEADPPPVLTYHKTGGGGRSIDRVGEPRTDREAAALHFASPDREDGVLRSTTPHRTSGFEALQSFGDAIAAFDMRERFREEKERRREERRAQRRLEREEDALLRREKRRHDREESKQQRRAERDTLRQSRPRRRRATSGLRSRSALSEASSRRSRSSTHWSHYDSDAGSVPSRRSRASSRGSRRSRQSSRSTSSRRSTSSVGSAGGRPPWRPPGSSAIGRTSWLGFDAYKHPEEGNSRSWLPPQF